MTLQSYCVFFGSTLIGHCDLEVRDASMGVASGKFRPTPEYAAVRSACVAAFADRLQEQQGLRVQTSDGEIVPACGGVMLLDAEGIPVSEIEVEISGIESPFCERFFL